MNSSSTIRLVGLSGSLRRGSLNSAILRQAATMMPVRALLDVETIRGIPLYNGDLEAREGIPERVVSLKERSAAADGLLLVTPEYNNSIPGPFKNAIDWLTRPAEDIARVFGGKPVALIGASQGSFGTILSQNAWLPVLRMLGADLWSGGRLLIPKAQSLVDEAGEITDPGTRARLEAFRAGFAAHVGATDRRRA